MKLNKWIKSIKRIRVSRKHQISGLRCDYAERLTNYSDALFKEFLDSLCQEDFITYPPYSQYDLLKEKIANRVGVTAANICLSTGSDAAIKTTIQATCTPNSDIIASTPCFPMYFIYGHSFGANVIPVPYSNDGCLSIENIAMALTESTRLVFLTNPNSPYGDYKDASEIEPLCKILLDREIVLLIDEAYVDFAPGDCLELIREFPNVLISRTFSKAWGAAGCRVGYLVGNAALIENLSNVELTYPISGASLKFINLILDNPEEALLYIAATIDERDKLCDRLELAGYDVVRSHTNTIHFHEKDGDNSRTVEILDRYNVAFKCGNRLTATAVEIPNDNRKTWVRLSVGHGILQTPFVKEIIG